MLPAKPSLANAAGNASNHTAASGPGDSEYGTGLLAAIGSVSVHLSVRNSALPPTPILSATSPPAPSASGFGSGLTTLGGFLAGASSSGSGAGGGGFFSSASSLGAAGFSSLLASSDSGSSGGSAVAFPFDFTFAAGVLPF